MSGCQYFRGPLREHPDQLARGLGCREVLDFRSELIVFQEGNIIPVVLDFLEPLLEFRMPLKEQGEPGEM